MCLRREWSFFFFMAGVFEVGYVLVFGIFAACVAVLFSRFYGGTHS